MKGTNHAGYVFPARAVGRGPGPRTAVRTADCSAGPAEHGPRSAAGPARDAIAGRTAIGPADRATGTAEHPPAAAGSGARASTHGRVTADQTMRTSFDMLHAPNPPGLRARTHQRYTWPVVRFAPGVHAWSVTGERNRLDWPAVRSSTRT